MNIYKNCSKINIRAQMSKMSIGTISEFLRMDINTEHPTGKQYLTRGVATLVHSKIESMPQTDALSAFLAHQERCDAIIKRGGDVKCLEEIRTVLYDKASHIYHCDGVRALEHIKTHHPIEGGINKEAELQGEE